jgi:hypothetical protein
MQPFSGYMNAADLQRSRELLETKPEFVSDKEFQVLKEQINQGVPQMEFAWVCKYPLSQLFNHSQAS